jgi:hypothetical protein
MICTHVASHTSSLSKSNPPACMANLYNVIIIKFIASV